MRGMYFSSVIIVLCGCQLIWHIHLIAPIRDLPEMAIIIIYTFIAAAKRFVVLYATEMREEWMEPRQNEPPPF